MICSTTIAKSKSDLSTPLIHTSEVVTCFVSMTLLLLLLATVLVSAD